MSEHHSLHTTHNSTTGRDANYSELIKCNHFLKYNSLEYYFDKFKIESKTCNEFL